MKKAIGIIILGLLLSSNAYAGWFNKDKITIKDCYDPKLYKNYKERVADAGLLWEWELNLKKDEAVQTTMDRDGKVRVTKTFIKAKTDRYIIVNDHTGTGGDFQFDLENEVYMSTYKIEGMEEKDILLKCNFK